jgi:Family of unknown function (DUF6518)
VTVTNAERSITPSREIVPPLLLGIGLGVAAFLPDLLAEDAAQLLTPVVSSGFGWGMAALFIGFFARRTQSAALAGVSTLVLATVTYHFLTVVTSPRWDLHPADIEGGETGVSDVLASVTPALVLWLAVSLCGGAVMGLLGHTITRGKAHQASIAAGVAFGLLAGEGTYTLFHTVFIWVGPIDSFIWNKVLSATMQLLLAALATVLALSSRRPTRSWSTFLIAATASAAASTVLWHLIQSARLHV